MKPLRSGVSVRAHRSPVFWLLLWLVWLGGTALANDTWVEGAGGTIKAMDEHPSVAMKSELVEVAITESTATVHCTFVFHNDGPATRVKMGFPEGGGGDVDVTKPRGFRSFRSWVDGKPIPTKIEGFTADEFHWDRFRTKVVDFAAGQTRRVEVRYEQPLGMVALGASPSKFFTYQFDTGASWKGKIGHARLVVRFSAMKGYSFMDRKIPPGYRVVRDWYEFEPSADDNFNIDFWSPPPKALLNDKWLVLEPEIARLAPFRGGDFVVPVRWLADKIGATVAWDQDTRTGTLKRGDAEVALAIGKSHDSATHEVRGRIEQGRLMVSAQYAIRRLGGSVTTWPSVSKFVMTLPPLPAD